jgi:hypothetical protein
MPSPPSDRACVPLSESPVNRSQQFARLLHLALVAPEAGEAHGGAKLDTEKSFVRVDVTEEFPFLVTKMAPYYDC